MPHMPHVPSFIPPPADAAAAKKRRRRVWFAGALGLFLLFILSLTVDPKEVGHSLLRAQPVPVMWGLGLMVVSYIAWTLAFVFAARAFGLMLPARSLAAVGFVSIGLNHALSLAGLLQHTIRVTLLRLRGSAAVEILAASFFDAYLNSLALLLLTPIGAFAVLRAGLVPPGQEFLVALFAGLMGSIFLLATGLIFSARLRGRVLGWSRKVWARVSKKPFPEALPRLDEAMVHGKAAAKRSPGRIVATAACILVEWATQVAVLGACFAAFGEDVGLGVLLAGFAVALTVSWVSALPGGLGILEAGLAATFAAFGIPLAQGVAAAVLFRVIYYVIPFLASLVLYVRLAGEDVKPAPPADSS